MTQSNVEFEFEAGKVYEITINPDDKHQYYGKNCRLTRVVELVSRELDQCKGVMDYSLAVEVTMPQYGNAERGSKPRIHYHGQVKFKDEMSVAEFFVERAYGLRQWSDVQFNKYRPEIWDEYCAKHKKFMLPYCKKYQVPYIISSTKPIFVSQRVYA